MVICSKWLMTKAVNITLWAMFCLVGKDLYTGKSFLFCPRLNPEYAVWLGKIQPPSYFKELYEVDSGHYVDEIHEVLKDSQRGGDWTLYLLHGQNTDSGNFSKPASFQVHLNLLLSSLSYTFAHFL
jgi:hypothetical protein